MQRKNTLLALAAATLIGPAAAKTDFNVVAREMTGLLQTATMLAPNSMLS